MDVSLPDGDPGRSRRRRIPRLRAVGARGRRCSPSASAGGTTSGATGDLDAIDELFTEPFVRHTGTGSERVSRAAYKGRLAEFQRVLSRVETTIDDRVVDGDQVWTRATSKGINRETGERSIVTWLLVQRIVDGRIAEQWVATFPGVDWTSAGS